MKANIKGVLNKVSIGRGVALDSESPRLIKPLKDAKGSDLANIQSNTFEANQIQGLNFGYRDVLTTVTNDLLVTSSIQLPYDSTDVVINEDENYLASRSIDVSSISLSDDISRILNISTNNGSYEIPIAEENWEDAAQTINDILLNKTQSLSVSYNEATGILTVSEINNIATIRGIGISEPLISKLYTDTTDEEKPYFQFSDAINDAELIGHPTAPTMPVEDSSNAIATTKFVHQVATGGVVYKGTFDASAGNYNALSTSRVGYLYYISKAGVINGVDWQIGDYLLVNEDKAKSVTKIDNTESSDIVRLNATQTLTNKSLTSPKLTGTPTTPTATAGTKNTQVASTAFVDTAITNAVNTLENTFDTKPTQGSTNAVQSGGVYDELAKKQDTLTAGTNINISSTNVISASFNAYQGVWNENTNYKTGEIVTYNINSLHLSYFSTRTPIANNQLFIATQDSKGQKPSSTSSYWKIFDSEKVNVQTSTLDDDFNLLSVPQNSGSGTEVYAVDNISPTVNLSTGLLKVPGGIDNYYTKSEVDTKIDAKDSLPVQAGNENKFLTTNGTTASWGNLPESSTSTKGIIKLATDSEITAGTSTNTAVSPKNLNSLKTGLETQITDIDTDLTNLTTRVTTTESDISGLNTRLTTAETNIGKKQDIDNMIQTVSDLETKYPSSKAVYDALALKANSADVYTKTDIDSTVSTINSAIGNKADKSTTYTKTEVDNLLSDKADTTNIPTKVSELTNDSKFQTDTQVADSISNHNTSNTAHSDIRTSISTETTNRTNEDKKLQEQIDALVSKSDVVDIVGTYSDLESYDTTNLGNRDIIKVLEDNTHGDSPSYYRWIISGESGSWNYVGSEALSYTKAESDSTFVPQTRTINNKDLSNNITLTYSDVKALSENTKYGADLEITGQNLQLKDQDGNDLGSSVVIPKTIYTAGDGINIDSNNVITNTNVSAEWGKVTGTLSNQIDLQTALDKKQDISNMTSAVTQETNTYPSNKAVFDALTQKDSLPVQTGNSGKFLTTDGSASSWEDLPEASTTDKGIIKLATAEEITTGTSTTSTLSVKDIKDLLNNLNTNIDTDLNTELGKKQDQLTAGFNIQINENNEISNLTGYRGSVYDRNKVYLPGDVIIDNLRNIYYCIAEDPSGVYNLNNSSYWKSVYYDNRTAISSNASKIYLYGSTIAGTQSSNIFARSFMVSAISPNDDATLNPAPYFNGTTGELTVPGGITDYSTTTEITTELDKKANQATTYTKTEVDNLLDDKADKSTTLSGYGITDTYTKTEIDNKLSSVYKYKGSVATYNNLPSTDLTIGDVYNVEDTGNNYAWTGTEWDSLAGIEDLSSYYTKTEADAKFIDNTELSTELAKKTDKVIPASAGNLATLDANGNLTDGGKKGNLANLDVVGSNQITDGSITSSKYADSSISGSKLMVNTIPGTALVDGIIDNSKVATNADIDQSKIKNLTTDLAGKANQATTYTKTEVNNLIAAKDSLPTQDSTTVGKFLQSTASGATWSSFAVIRTWED